MASNDREKDLDREIRAHLELEAEEHLADGMAQQDARYAARRAFGNVTCTQEDVRRVWTRRWLDDGRQDVRYAVRSLTRSPGFACIAITTLALGIGATTSIFSVVSAVLLRPLPYGDPDGLVAIVENVPAAESPTGAAMRLSSMNQDEFDWWRGRSTTLSHMAVLLTESRTMSTPEGTVRLPAARVSPALFSMLGVQPVLGRWLPADEERPDASVVVLSAATWRHHFASDPNVVDRAIVLDGRSYSIVGVMPPAFDVPAHDTAVWLPFAVEPPRPGLVAIIRVLSRLREGVSIEAAAAEANVLGHQLRGFAPEPGSAPRFEVVRLHDQLVSPVRPALRVLVVAVGVVLLIVCANVANLLLARGSARQPEIGTRHALGAGRARIVRQVLTESLVLSVAGGASGVLVAYGGVHLLKALAIVDTPALFRRGQAGALLPRVDDVLVDAGVLTFALAVAVLTGIVFGLAPALRIASVGHGSGRGTLTMTSMMAGGGPKSGGALAVVQLAMATMLLIGAALLMHSFVKLSSVDAGFESEGVLHFQVVLPQQQPLDRKLQIAQELIARVRLLPKVEAAGFTNSPPLENLSLNASLLPPGMTDREYLDIPRRLRPQVRTVSADYLRAMGVRLIEGRWLDETDGPRRPRVALVNRTYARLYLGESRAIGAALRQGTSSLEVVGVVEDLRMRTLDGEPEPTVFAETRQWLSAWGDGPAAADSFVVGPSGAVSFAVRTTGDPLRLAADLRGMVGQVDSSAAVEGMAPMEQIVSASIARPRFYAVLLVTFGAIACALAAIGVYGVLAYRVTRRTREIGIRLALGAGPRQVLSLILRQGGALVGIGIPLGIGGAVISTRALSGMLFGLSPLDVRTYAVTALGFAAVAMLASYVPARRATRVDPLLALRQE